MCACVVADEDLLSLYRVRACICISWLCECIHFTIHKSSLHVQCYRTDEWPKHQHSSFKMPTRLHCLSCKHVFLSGEYQWWTTQAHNDVSRVGAVYHVVFCLPCRMKDVDKRIEGAKREMKDEIRKMKDEIRQMRREMREEMREEMRQEISNMREEMREEEGNQFSSWTHGNTDLQEQASPWIPQRDQATQTDE